MAKFQVIVGNVGMVYNGNDKEEATKAFETYVKLSDIGVGRAGWESVVVIANDEVIMEHAGKLETSS